MTWNAHEKKEKLHLAGLDTVLLINSLKVYRTHGYAFTY